jgi:hypothetical protein
VLEPKAGLTVKIGGTATDYIVMAQALHTWLDALNTAWTPVANDGGAALKTALTSALLSFVNAVKATKGQVE